MSENTGSKSKQRQVFVSYAQADKKVAREVVASIRDAGLRMWIDTWELAPGDSIVEPLQKAIATSDIILILLSKNAVASDWVRYELTAALYRELQDRAVTVIPALIEDCVIPPVLADRQFLDLRRDLPAAMRRLVQQLGATPDLDFTRLDAQTFEGMVGTLLENLGFSVQRTPIGRDSTFDFLASYRSRDPFGAEQTTTWLVEVKFYRDQRVSISALQRMLGYLVTAGGSKKGLVVTNGRLTSVARTFLVESIERSGREIRVIDGTELVTLLIQHPEIVHRYFKRGADND